MDYIQAKAKLDACGQTHLLRFYDSLSDSEQYQLLEQIDALDVQLLDVFAAYQHQGELQRGKLEPLGALTLERNC